MHPDRSEERDRQPDGEDKAPFFSSWNRFYLFVLIHLAFLIALFALITRAFD